MKMIPLRWRGAVKKLGGRAVAPASFLPDEARRKPRPPDLRRFEFFHSFGGVGVDWPRPEGPTPKAHAFSPSREGTFTGAIHARLAADTEHGNIALALVVVVVVVLVGPIPVS